MIYLSFSSNFQWLHFIQNTCCKNCMNYITSHELCYITWRGHHVNFLVKVLLNTSLLFNAPFYGIRSAEQRLSYTVHKNDTFQVLLLLKYRSEHLYVCCTLSWLFTSGEQNIQVLCEMMPFWLINTSNYLCFYRKIRNLLLLDTVSDTRRIESSSALLW